MSEPPSSAADALKPSDSYVQSFARGLEVLRSFGPQAPRQTLSECAQRVGLTRAGARRILLTLQTLGYVVTDGRYFSLTPRVLELGFAYLGAQPWRGLAQPILEALTETLGESSSAAVLDGADIVYVLRVPAKRIMSINLGVGTRLPAYCTSMGRVLLAALAEDERIERVQAWARTGLLTARTERTITQADDLLDLLARVRRQGWAHVDQELEAGLQSMAVPLHDRAGRVIAALNVSAPTALMSPTQMRQQMLLPLTQAAQRITAQWG
jgi:IclR family pca regulon transcriptional regulator